MVIAGGSDDEYLNNFSTLSHVEILTSGSSASCHFDSVADATGETGIDYKLESSAHVEGGSGKYVNRIGKHICHLSSLRISQSALFTLKSSKFTSKLV